MSYVVLHGAKSLNEILLRSSVRCELLMPGGTRRERGGGGERETDRLTDRQTEGERRRERETDRQTDTRENGVQARK